MGMLYCPKHWTHLKVFQLSFIPDVEVSWNGMQRKSGARQKRRSKPNQEVIDID